MAKSWTTKPNKEINIKTLSCTLQQLKKKPRSSSPKKYQRALHSNRPIFISATANQLQVAVKKRAKGILVITGPRRRNTYALCLRRITVATVLVASAPWTPKYVQITNAKERPAM